MAANDRARSVALLFACLFAVPLIGLMTAQYLGRHVEEQFRDAIVNHHKLMTDADYRARGLSYARFCHEARYAPAVDSDQADLCSKADEIRLVNGASIGVAGVGALLAGLIFGAPRLAGTKRQRMVRVFAPAVRAVMLLLSVSVVVQGALLVYGIYTFEAIAIQRVHFVILGLIALGAVVACVTLVRSGLTVLRVEPMPVPGMVVDAAGEPRVVGLVNSIADRLGAPRPDLIVVGLEPSFFVTAAPVRLPDGLPTPDGRKTLYLSLALMRTMTTEEFAAVIGHELGHFRGEDLVYSAKFAPMFARMNNALAALSRTVGNASDLARIPALVVLSNFLLEFAAAVRSIGRERELRADEAGAEAASRSALARALVKTALYVPQWGVVSESNTDEIVKGRMLRNLVVAFAASCARATEGLDWAEQRQALSSTVQPHPIDTHPPLVQRLQNLHTALDEIMDRELALPEAAASTLLADEVATAEALSSLEAKWLVAIRAVVPPTPDAALQPV